MPTTLPTHDHLACPKCGKAVRVNNDGNLRTHTKPSGTRCSYQPPKPIIVKLSKTVLEGALRSSLEPLAQETGLSINELKKQAKAKGLGELVRIYAMTHLIPITREDLEKRLDVGDKLKDIANDVGSNRESMRLLVKRFGLVPAGKLKAANAAKVSKKSLKDLVNQGLNDIEIAKVLGIAPTKANQLRRDAKLYRQVDTSMLTKENLTELYIKQGKSARVMSTTLGVSTHAILEHLRKYGIPIRGNGGAREVELDALLTKDRILSEFATHKSMTAVCDSLGIAAITIRLRMEALGITVPEPNGTNKALIEFVLAEELRCLGFTVDMDLKLPTWRAAADLALPEFKLALEHDGEHHHSSPSKKDTDVRKIQAFADAGWKMIRLREGSLELLSKHDINLPMGQYDAKHNLEKTMAVVEHLLSILPKSKLGARKKAMETYLKEGRLLRYSQACAYWNAYRRNQPSREAYHALNNQARVANEALASTPEMQMAPS